MHLFYYFNGRRFPSHYVEKAKSENQAGNKMGRPIHHHYDNMRTENKTVEMRSFRASMHLS